MSITFECLHPTCRAAAVAFLCRPPTLPPLLHCSCWKPRSNGKHFQEVFKTHGLYQHPPPPLLVCWVFCYTILSFKQTKKSFVMLTPNPDRVHTDLHYNSTHHRRRITCCRAVLCFARSGRFETIHPSTSIRRRVWILLGSLWVVPWLQEEVVDSAPECINIFGGSSSFTRALYAKDKHNNTRNHTRNRGQQVTYTLPHRQDLWCLPFIVRVPLCPRGLLSGLFSTVYCILIIYSAPTLVNNV